MSEWVSVFDRKPELETSCLLIAESGEMVTGWLRKINEDNIYWCFGNEYTCWGFEFDYEIGGIITHWMPLPEPPEITMESNADKLERGEE